MKERENGYVREPAVRQVLQERYRTVLMAITGEVTVTDGAKRLGMSRVRFQTLMHRGLAGLIGELTPKTPGRRPKPVEQSALERKMARLENENAKLRNRVELTEKLLGTAGDLLRGKLQLRARPPRPNKTPEPGDPLSEEPDGLARYGLAASKELTEHFGSRARAATLLGVHPTTLRRWEQNESEGGLLVKKRGPARRQRPTATALSHVEVLLRESKCKIGVEVLRQEESVFTRSELARIKEVLAAQLERDRVAAKQRVIVSRPGVIRGFDEMNVPTLDGTRHLYAFADGGVQYRTTMKLLEEYTGKRTAETTNEDFDRHGAPLVWRVDRAAQHETDDVLEVLRRHGVLLLHGPPHCPWYYGQLERQNRDHREQIDLIGLVPAPVMAVEIQRMTNLLNNLWRRASLGYKTPQEAWMKREPIGVDRNEFADEVSQRTERIAAELRNAGESDSQASRFAIEAALKQRELIRCQPGGWC